MLCKADAKGLLRHLRAQYVSYVWVYCINVSVVAFLLSNPALHLREALTNDI